MGAGGVGGVPIMTPPSSPNLQAAVLLEQERQQQEMAKMAPPVPRPPPPEVAPMGARAPLPPRGERCAPPPLDFGGGGSALLICRAVPLPASRWRCCGLLYGNHGGFETARTAPPTRRRQQGGNGGGS